MDARSLHARLALRVALASALFALLAGMGVYRWIYAQTLADGAQTLQALAGAVERTAAVGAYANDAILLQEITDGLARNPMVAAVSVRAGTLTVLGRRGGLALPAPVGKVSGSVQRALASPFDAAEEVGELRLDPDLVALGANANRQASAMTGLLILLTGLVALVVNGAAQRLVALPIARLATELACMAPGTAERLAVPADHADDEIARLVATANQLLHSNQLALERERELRAEVEAMEAQYRRIFDSSSAGIFVLDAVGRLINANPTVFRLLGCSEQEWHARTGRDFIDEVFAHPERVRALVAEAGRSGRTASGDFALKSPDGIATHWVHCIFSVQDRVGELTEPTPAFVEGVLYDVTERRRAEDAARHVADHDTLTGLLNRGGCAALVASWRPGRSDIVEEPYTTLFIDLDGFKAVNDRLGHGAGDHVLREAAARLQGCVRRTSDLVSRNGGDEFVVVLRGLRHADAAVGKIADQIGRALQEPIQATEAEAVCVGVSIGLASFPFHGPDLEAVLHQADVAMYEVKRTGKNSFAMARPVG